MSTIDAEPLVVCAPDQPPDAVQLLASVDDQFNVIVPPRLSLDGLAVMLTIGSLTAGSSFTVTVTLSLAFPPSPLQLML